MKNVSARDFPHCLESGQTLLTIESWFLIFNRQEESKSRSWQTLSAFMSITKGNAIIREIFNSIGWY